MALTKWQPSVLRNSVDEEGEVSWLELFFDLVYVAALIQLGNQLADDVSWAGVARFAGVFTLLWWTWTGTTAFMNAFAVDDVVHRLLIFLQMFAVGNLALVAVSPLDDRSMWMVVAFVIARVPLVLMYARAKSDNEEARGLSRFMAQLVTGGAALWLASLLVPTPYRFAVWGLALAVEFFSPLVFRGRIQGPRMHQGHLRERYALFTIIVLGESFVKVLSELADEGVSVQTQVFGTVIFVIGIALWWTYFDDVADSVIRTGGGRTFLWIYAHLPLAMAMTAYGVAAKKGVVVESFDGSIKDSYLWLLVGSVALGLAAVAVLDWVTYSPHFAVGPALRVGPRVAAAVVVLFIPVVIGTSPALLAVGLVALVAAAQIAVEAVVATRAERQVAAEVREHLSSLDGTCEDLAHAPRPAAPEHGCADCDAAGKAPVQLRQCLICGHVGCCDDTPGRHARAHWEETGHRLIATIEPGDGWAYCYEHETVDPDWRRRTAAEEHAD